MRHFVALSVFFLAASLTAQVEHAPTVAQCQADQRVWLSKLEAQPPDMNLPDFTTLRRWSAEMADCEEVDSKNRWLYFNTQSESNNFQAARMFRFLNREHLWDKFIEEDAAGQR